jgi:tRNA dimethylallyltransferase
LAKALDGEIISADSRQVYKGMDIGTGKDFHEFIVDGAPIPYQLIDICEPGERYHIHAFAQDFAECYEAICSKERQPILCGGSGLYLEAALKGHPYSSIPVNEALRAELALLDKEALRAKLLELPETVRHHADLSSAKRMARAIEVGEWLLANEAPAIPKAPKAIIFGTDLEREARRMKIEARLKQRLENGLIEEVESLLANGLSFDDLDYYGLEYRWVGLYLKGEIDKALLFERLKVAIQQFAKRQMTWFRKMEKDGFQICWIDAQLPVNEQVEKVLRQLD